MDSGGDSFRIGALTRHADLQVREDLNAAPEYKRHLTPVLTRRALTTAAAA